MRDRSHGTVPYFQFRITRARRDRSRHIVKTQDLHYCAVRYWPPQVTVSLCSCVNKQTNKRTNEQRSTGLLTRASITYSEQAGLGRTATCIGCYIMKHYDLTAAEAIGWMRVCRPGSVIGPQQHYLQQMEGPMRREGMAFREKTEGSNASAATSTTHTWVVRLL